MCAAGGTASSFVSSSQGNFTAVVPAKPPKCAALSMGAVAKKGSGSVLSRVSNLNSEYHFGKIVLIDPDTDLHLCVCPLQHVIGHEHRHLRRHPLLVRGEECPSGVLLDLDGRGRLREGGQRQR